MDTEILDQLAHQLRVDKTPSCGRAIDRMLEAMKKRCENGEYATPDGSGIRVPEFMEKERSCHKARMV
jgi:hypothetical protein